MILNTNDMCTCQPYLPHAYGCKLRIHNNKNTSSRKIKRGGLFTASLILVCFLVLLLWYHTYIYYIYIYIHIYIHRLLCIYAYIPVYVYIIHEAYVHIYIYIHGSFDTYSTKSVSVKCPNFDLGFGSVLTDRDEANPSQQINPTPINP